MTVHPAEPAPNETLWYRGWECGFESLRHAYTGSGYVAYLGGPDLDCIQVDAPTWEGLLDEIDDHDMTEAAEITRLARSAQ